MGGYPGVAPEPGGPRRRIRQCFLNWSGAGRRDSCSSRAKVGSARRRSLQRARWHSPIAESACSWSALTLPPTSTTCSQRRLGRQPTAVPGADLLWAQNIDPEAAVAGYRERVVAPYRGAVPDEELRALEEQLAGQCTVEVAAFDEFARLLSDPASTASFDHVFFDTAPTGHTLRLLSLPSAWSGYIETSPAGASCLGPLAGLEAKQEQYEATAAALADPAQTTVVLVARADPRALGRGSTGRRRARHTGDPQPAARRQRRPRGPAGGRHRC